MKTLLLFLTVIYATLGARVFSSLGSYQQILEISSPSDDAIRFIPQISGPVRHVVSVIEYPTSQQLSPANYSIIFSTLDSSIYQLHYPGANSGTYQLLQLSNVQMAGGPTFIIDSFVVYMPSRIIFALDISTMKIRIISMADGRWLGDLATLPQGTGGYMTCSDPENVIYNTPSLNSPGVLYISIASANSIYAVELLGSSTSLAGVGVSGRGPYKLSVPAILSPCAIEIREAPEPYYRKAYVLSDTGRVIYLFYLLNLNTWLLAPARNAITFPSNVFPYNSSTVFRPTRLLVLRDERDDYEGGLLEMFIPDPGCSKIHYVAVNSSESEDAALWAPLSGTNSIESPYDFLMAPYMLAIAPWNDSQIIVADAMLSLMTTDKALALSLQNLVQYGKTFGCKLSDAVALWPWPSTPNYYIPGVWQAILVSCNQVLLKAIADTPQLGNASTWEFAPYASFVGSLEVINTIDINPFVQGEFYAGGKDNLACFVPNAPQSSFSIYKGLPNPYATDNGNALDWTKLYSGPKTIYALAFHPTLSILCLLEQGSTIKCIDSTTGGVITTNSFVLQFGGHDITDIAWADSGSSLCAVSNGANQFAALSWMGLSVGLRLDVTASILAPRSIAGQTSTSTCFVSGKVSYQLASGSLQTDTIVKAFRLQRVAGVVNIKSQTIIAETTPNSPFLSQYEMVVSMEGTLLSNSSNVSPPETPQTSIYIPSVPLFTFIDFMRTTCLAQNNTIWNNDSCVYLDVQSPTPPLPPPSPPSESLPPATTSDFNDTENETLTITPTHAPSFTPRRNYTYPPYDVESDSGWFESPLSSWMMVFAVLIACVLLCFGIILAMGAYSRYKRKRLSRSTNAAYTKLEESGRRASLSEESVIETSRGPWYKRVTRGIFRLCASGCAEQLFISPPGLSHGATPYNAFSSGGTVSFLVRQDELKTAENRDINYTDVDLKDKDT